MEKIKDFLKKHSVLSLVLICVCVPANMLLFYIDYRNLIAFLSAAMFMFCGISLLGWKFGRLTFVHNSFDRSNDSDKVYREKCIERAPLAFVIASIAFVIAIAVFVILALLK